MAVTSHFARIKADPSRLRKTSWRQYAVRFAFGGLVTAFAGFLGTTFGPAIGGLFLAFPAILPASLTLVKKHEGEEAAGDDAAGAVAGSIGLIAFGALVWALAAHLAAWGLLLLATIAWLVVSVIVWLLGQRTRGRQRQG
jgi:uncharacterized membrane protein (GlpM family)